MKAIRVALPILLLSSLAQFACASERIIDVREKRDITREELVERMTRVEEVVVGEKHDTKVIQDAEARLFTEFARTHKGRTTLAWEFWSWSEKPKLDELYARFSAGKIMGEAFLKGMFGEKVPELTYLPVLEAAKKAGARVLPTNLTREEKAPVVKGGLEALDPKLLPPGFELGGTDYYDRFVKALGDYGGHGDPSLLKNYFAAQCLVDDVVAYHLTGDRKTESAFLIIGDFHTRYFDGAWKRLMARGGSDSRLLIQVSEKSDESDWNTVMNDAKYGPISDILILL
jgi:uncharacterized iron-regulated protein